MNEWIWSVGEIILTAGNRIARRKICLIIHANPTWIDVRSTPGLCLYRPENKLLRLIGLKLTIETSPQIVDTWRQIERTGMPLRAAILIIRATK